MPKDISADKRFELGMKIQRKETDMDEFYQEKQSYQRALDNFNNRFQQLSVQYDEISYHQAEQGSRKAREEFELNQELNQRIRNYVSEQSEGVEHAYSRARQEVDEEIENLHKERNALPWE
jgi:phosphoenolpyruvate-protein kinase (PTS system EI component)